MQLLRAETGWDTRQLINLLILIMVFSGVFGFIYELLFYKIDTGRFIKRGSSYGPWIPIYVFGGAAYTLLVYPFKEHPLLVFVMCVVVSGVMEYVTGWVLYNVFHTRLWDYNTEIWNFGNINGYVCLRSVMFFGVSGVLLVYMVGDVLWRFRRASGLHGHTDHDPYHVHGRSGSHDHRLPEPGACNDRGRPAVPGQ